MVSGSVPPRLPVTVRVPRRNEIKSVDLYLAAALNDTHESIQLVNGVAPGTGNYQRIGNKITPVSIDLSVVALSTSTSLALPCRFALIYDKQPGATVPVFSDIYQSVNSSGSTSTNQFPQRNRDTTDRFHTLYCRDIVLAPASAAYGGGPSIFQDYAIRSLVKLPMQFKGADATLGSVTTGAIYFVAYCWSSATSGPAVVNVTGNTRFRYTD